MYRVNATALPKIFFHATILHTGSWGHAEVTKPHHLLVLSNDGTFEISLLGKTFEMTRDQALFIPRNTPYSLKSHGTIEHVVIHFDADIEEQCETRTDRDSSELSFNIPLFIKADTALRLKIERAAMLGEDDAVAAVERSIALLRALLSMTALNISTTESHLVHKIKRYLEENMYEHITLADLSATFGYTKQYLIRIFKSATGKSPILYLNEQRLLKSTAVLLNEEKSIAEVAESCGFDDYNYFSRAFRRRYGVSPREYRKKRLTI